MALELALIFPDPSHVLISLRDKDDFQHLPQQDFKSPFDELARRELTWYLETYSSHYTTEADDVRAAAIAGSLKERGAALFNGVFASPAAWGLFNEFYQSKHPGRLLSISSLHPAVLAEPWEMLCDPASTFLFFDHPRISVRRRLPGVGRKPYRPKPKDRLHLLFVVSRPDDAGLIDPRSDPQAVMDALEAGAPGSVDVEFLRPPTLKALNDRLNDNNRPAVDILHFDGHGAYDPNGQLNDKARQTLSAGGAAHLMRKASPTGPQGFLLFEDGNGQSAPVLADGFGDLLQSKRVGLVILSACQSAMVGGEDALGSVAPRLIRAGIPSVLAMTQSVLASTTRKLFGQFYRELGGGRAIGASLDAARAQLRLDPTRDTRQRTAGPFNLELEDWFVPALYQASVDRSLLKRPMAPAQPLSSPPQAAVPHNLPDMQELGFHGRRRELRDLERWLVNGTRRIVITGFGGQGKTVLVTEAARWLLRTGMFDAACFISFKGYQGTDPVQLAVSTLATVLDVNLNDAAAAETALRQKPLLLILDNLEALEDEGRQELLTAAVGWSEQAGSRVLLTTRPDRLAHEGYPATGSARCRYLSLSGLSADDALSWFQALDKLNFDRTVPRPAAEAVQELLARVRFHPLSIGVLASLLAQQRVADVAEALQAQLINDDDPFRASLNLQLGRLEKLDKDAKDVLPALGVFADGASEPELRTVLSLDELRWQRVRDVLRRTGLIEVRTIPGVMHPFIHFHPTLAAVMRERLSADDLERFGERYRSAYYKLSGELYHHDVKLPESVRGLVQWELPNLFAAVLAALQRGDPNAAIFVMNVDLFLKVFGRTRDRAQLQARATAAGGSPGTDAWFFAQSTLGEQRLEQKKPAEAEEIFSAILRQLGDTPSGRRGMTMVRLGYCYQASQQHDRAHASFRNAILELKNLPSSHFVQSWGNRAVLGIAAVLAATGRLAEARDTYRNGILLATALGNTRDAAFANGQLGNVHLGMNEPDKAEQAFKAAIDTFATLNEPASMAHFYDRLAVVYRQARNFPEAERAYREAAFNKEKVNDRQGAAETWVGLGQLAHQQGLPMAQVAPWYRKAMSVLDAGTNASLKAGVRADLSNLLRSDPQHLAEARDLAGQALAIKQTLDPNAEEIWRTQDLVAQIASLQGDHDTARCYRQLARQSYALAPVSLSYLHRHQRLIGAVLETIRRPELRPQLQDLLSMLLFQGMFFLGQSLGAFVNGNRDEAALTDILNFEDSLILHTIFLGERNLELASKFPRPPGPDQTSDPPLLYDWWVGTAPQNFSVSVAG